MSIENPFKRPSEEKKIEDEDIPDNAEERDKWWKREIKRTKDFTELDYEVEDIEEMLRGMLKAHNPYSETFTIKPDGKFGDLRLDGTPAYLGLGKTPEEFYQIALEIEKKYPGYHFSFETDPQGKWMKYTVSKDESGK